MLRRGASKPLWAKSSNFKPEGLSGSESNMQDKIYLDVLEKRGMSNTKTRRIVFHLLANSQKPLSPAEIILGSKGAMDKTTVYRSLDLFEKIGIVKQVTIGWKQKYELSDTFSHHHHHMSCVICGKIISFEESYKLSAELERLEEAYRFIIDEHTIELRGRCSSCRSKANVYA